MPTGGGGGCSTSRQRSGCIRTSGRAPRQDTTVALSHIKKAIFSLQQNHLYSNEAIMSH
jgi:hypothetical protein